MRALVPFLLASCAPMGFERVPIEIERSSAPTKPSATVALAPSPTAAPTVAPNLLEEEFEPRIRELPLDGFEPAVVILPRQKGKKARLAIVAHGAGGRPEPHCAHYERLLGDGFVVACTRGRSASPHLPETERGYFYDGHPALGRELRALFVALGATAPFAAITSLDDALYIGYSQGATMGILALHEDGDVARRFSRILLVEGGSAEWTVALSKKMAARDVRVAIACGQKSCHEAGQRSRSYMIKAGLAVKTAYASGAGHTYGGAVETKVVELIPWLLED